MIIIENKKKSFNNLINKYPNAVIIDITSKGDEPFIKFSPFYPHGNIPIPFSKNEYAMTVEGIWQGLKVFENHDIDTSKFYIKDMINIKRSERKYGRVKGHRKGIYSNILLDYKTARKEIYLKSYAWVLDNLLIDVVDKLKCIASKNDLILLDYATNLDIDNLSKPLSHAGLVKRYIEKKYPELKDNTFEKPAKESKKEVKKTNKGKRKKKASIKRKKSNNIMNQEQLKLF